MNIVMHLGLSQAIRNAVEKELDIKMDAFSFMYGNIKPDLKASSVKIPHFKHTAMNLVQAEIEKLTTLRLNEPRRWSKQLSERIGVITHYLSDFFCYAHTETSRVNIGHICCMNSKSYTTFRKAISL
ncbi:MAG: hypothetical protein VR66_20225 [Peptococcaceae bacterium BRH_c23]|nr:MAG: hypothetical protein VR66_20225 [Peptococcaceae bacterium BRH_c23]